MSSLPIASRPVESRWAMYKALVTVSLVCGLLVVGAFELTRPFIEANRTAARERAVVRAVPTAHRILAYVRQSDGSFLPVTTDRPAQPGHTVYATFDRRGDLVGWAIEAEAMGYQDTIRILYGYCPDAETVCGLEVLESRETPGIGDRIETDSVFLANFTQLDVSLVEGELRHSVEVVRPGRRTQPWQVDTITGATISSLAVATAVQRSAAAWIPSLARHRGDFVVGEEGR